ncbi:hypothetical protein H072_9627 [Dactylellina haptotyla CBS 200.50]|uniref:RAVE subunit 2/Rogdi n=1 Tax=Dactylellina haptotyla (strain CBS 200.50) TaxID=1284197 RepID=S8A1H7_DACHA|nr:hypothetical protein H072_9627 [Dactylellina haptotyla CBS 200.50]
MRIEVYPKVEPDVLEREVREAALRELAWLITEIQESLLSLRSGLEECLSLLAPTQPGSTLVLSTSRSEGLKGFVTRVGSAVVKGDMQVKMHGLPNTKGLGYYRLQLVSPPSSSEAPSTTPPSPTSSSLLLPQLTDCRNFVHSALTTLPSQSEVDTHKSLPVLTKTASAIIDAKLLASQLDSLLSDIRSARDILNTTQKSNLFPYHAVEASLFDPPLPENLALDVTIQDAAVVTELRLLENTNPAAYTGLTALSMNIDQHLSNFNFREKIAGAFKSRKAHGARHTGNGENEVYTYRGAEVRVKERIKVESQDPSLMSVTAKLGALEHNLAMGKTSLEIIMRSGCGI